MFVHFPFSYFLSHVFFCLLSCVRFVLSCVSVFLYDILTFRSRVVLACHVFPFLRSSLCFVIGSSSCVLSACSHVFYFMYGVCFRGQLPLSFIMFRCHMLCFALVSSSIFVSPHFSRARSTHSFTVLYSHTITFPNQFSHRPLG